MERFNRCLKNEQTILIKMYEYFGFNEVVSFEDFIDFMFYNAKPSVTFENTVNHVLAHIVTSFKRKNEQYSTYIKYMWLKTNDMLEHMSVGSDIEYDPKGIIRLFIKTNYKELRNSKR